MNQTARYYVGGLWPMLPIDLSTDEPIAERVPSSEPWPAGIGTIAAVNE